MVICMEKIKLKQAVVVEGKYDKIKLSSFIDGVIICTNGFGVFKDKKTAELIRHYAENCGIIILTDSDSAGFKIRGHIKGICPEGKIINLYIPDIFGKEKREERPSKEGKLGVEGIDTELLRETFERAGILTSEPKKACISKLDFYELGLSGKPNSGALRARTAEKLGLPSLITANALLEAVNTMTDKTGLEKLVKELKENSETGES